MNSRIYQPKVKVRTNVSQCLTKLHAVKMYGGVEVQLHAGSGQDMVVERKESSLPWRESGQIHPACSQSLHWDISAQYANQKYRNKVTRWSKGVQTVLEDRHPVLLLHQWNYILNVIMNMWITVRPQGSYKVQINTKVSDTCSVARNELEK
jgi:hypothetical protein